MNYDNFQSGGQQTTAQPTRGGGTSFLINTGGVHHHHGTGVRGQAPVTMTAAGTGASGGGGGGTPMILNISQLSQVSELQCSFFIFLSIKYL